MATAHIDEDRLIPLVQNFSTGRASGFRGSDVVLKKRCNTCKHRDYVGQDSRRYQSPITVRVNEPVPGVPGVPKTTKRTIKV